MRSDERWKKEPVVVLSSKRFCRFAFLHAKTFDLEWCDPPANKMKERCTRALSDGSRACRRIDSTVSRPPLILHSFVPEAEPNGTTQSAHLREPCILYCGRSVPPCCSFGGSKTAHNPNDTSNSLPPRWIGTCHTFMFLMDHKTRGTQNLRSFNLLPLPETNCTDNNMMKNAKPCHELIKSNSHQ